MRSKHLSESATKKAIERASEHAAKLASMYDVPRSAIVWKGEEHFCVVKNGKIIEI